MEFEIFHPWGGCVFYLAAVTIRNTYMCLGRQTVEPTRALELQKKHHGRAFHRSYVFAIFIAMVFAGTQVYTHLLPNLFRVDASGCEKVVPTSGGVNELFNDKLAGDSIYEDVGMLMKVGMEIRDEVSDRLLISELADVGAPALGGFSATSHAYKEFLAKGSVNEILSGKPVDESIYEDVDKLMKVGNEIRDRIMDTPLPDLPEASLGGQLETRSNVMGHAGAQRKMHMVFASLFTDRVNPYRGEMIPQLADDGARRYATLSGGSATSSMTSRRATRCSACRTRASRRS
jgi:hypothetical protein